MIKTSPIQWALINSGVSRRHHSRVLCECKRIKAEHALQKKDFLCTSAPKSIPQTLDPQYIQEYIYIYVYIYILCQFPNPRPGSSGSTSQAVGIRPRPHLVLLRSPAELVPKDVRVRGLGFRVWGSVLRV